MSHRWIPALLALVAINSLVSAGHASAPCAASRTCDSGATAWCDGVPNCNLQLGGVCEQLLRCPDPTLPYCDEPSRSCVPTPPSVAPARDADAEPVSHSMLTALKNSVACRTRECCVNRTKVAYQVAPAAALPWCVGNVRLGPAGDTCMIEPRCPDVENTTCDNAYRVCRRSVGDPASASAQSVRAAAGGCLSSSDCSDGVYCNGAEVCTNGQCAEGNAPACGPGFECSETAHACRPALHQQGPGYASILVFFQSLNAVLLWILFIVVIGCCMASVCFRIERRRRYIRATSVVSESARHESADVSLYSNLFGKKD